MKIPTCSNQDIAKEFARKIAGAKRADKRKRNAEGEKALPLTVDRAQIARGELPEGSAEPTALEEALKECVVQLQTIFKGYAMRRTIQSLDYDGNPIWGADPPLDVFVFLKPNDRERELVHLLADDSIAQGMDTWQNVSCCFC